MKLPISGTSMQAIQSPFMAEGVWVMPCSASSARSAKLSAVMLFQPNSPMIARPSEPEIAPVIFAMRVCSENVMPLASMPVLNLPYSAQSGVNMNIRTLTTPVAMAFTTDSPMYAPVLPLAKKKMSRFMPTVASRQLLYSVILLTFFRMYGTAKDATAKGTVVIRPTYSTMSSSLKT